MVKKIKFVKLANAWFVLLPDYKGKVEDLEMVMGADTLLEIVSMGSPMITFNVSDDAPKEWNENDYEAKLVDADQYGSTYRITSYNISMNIWLCNVTKLVLGEFPKIFYFSI